MVKKIIRFDMYIKTSEQTPTYSYVAKQKVMSNDKDSTQITFNLLDVSPDELSGSSASILLYMQDGSFFQSSDVTIDRNSVIYTMKEEETKHSGNTKVQIVLKKGTVQTASLIYNFEIEKGLEKYPITEVMIQDWTTLTEEAKAFVEQIEGFTLEQFVANKMGQELANLEVNYATRLTGLEQKDNQLTAQLAQKATKQDLANIGDAKPSGVYTTLAELQTAFPTGDGKNIYLVVADGKWYYWTGSTWTAGGVYQSTGIAEESVKPNHISKLNYTNLFDKHDTVAGQYIDRGTGVATNLNPNVIASNYIPITGGETYEIYNSNNLNQGMEHLGAFYDENKVYISGMNGASGGTFIIESPPNARYARVSVGSDKLDVMFFNEEIKKDLDWLIVKPENLNKEVLNMLSSPSAKWSGKKVNFLGDSITFGYGLTTPATEVYHALLKEKLGLSVVRNYGISGTKIAKTSPTDTSAMSARYSSMDNDADLIMIMGGTNDYGHHSGNGNTTAPFGIFTDRTAETFYGALHVLYSGLIAKYPSKTIVIMTPTPRTYAMNSSADDDRRINPDTNKNMLDYVNAIREVAEYYSLPIIDLYKNSGMTPLISLSRSLYMPDYLHPNAAGHALIADKLVGHLNYIV